MEAPAAGPLRRLVIAAGIALTVLGLGVLVLLLPVFTHAALDAAGSAAILGFDPATTHAVSDRTIGELIAGPGTFAFPAATGGPAFYDAREASHLRDARTVLYLFLGLATLGLVGLVAGLAPRRRDPAAWRAVQAGAAVLAAAFAALGIFFTVAFEPAFTLFHEVFFPGGNWQFDTATERMVQLYPTPFWEIAAMALAILVLALCAAAWLVAAWRIRVLRAVPRQVGVRGVAGSGQAGGARP